MFLQKRSLFVAIVVAGLFFPVFDVFAQEAKVFFSPKGGCERAIIEQLSKTQKTADIAMYNLTSEPIAQEVGRMKTRGVTVRIFLDRSQKGQKSSQAGFLKDQGIEVRIYKGSGLMHHKFAVLDGKILLTGSFNWTENAQEDNAENLLILSDKKLIAQYTKEFESLWRQGQEADVRRDLQKTVSSLVKFVLKFMKELFRNNF